MSASQHCTTHSNTVQHSTQCVPPSFCGAPPFSHTFLVWQRSRSFCAAARLRAHAGRPPNGQLFRPTLLPPFYPAPVLAPFSAPHPGLPRVSAPHAHPTALLSSIYVGAAVPSQSPASSIPACRLHTARRLRQRCLEVQPTRPPITAPKRTLSRRPSAPRVAAISNHASAPRRRQQHN